MQPSGYCSRRKHNGESSRPCRIRVDYSAAAVLSYFQSMLRVVVAGGSSSWRTRRRRKYISALKQLPANKQDCLRILLHCLTHEKALETKVSANLASVSWWTTEMWRFLRKLGLNRNHHTLRNSTLRNVSIFLPHYVFYLPLQGFLHSIQTTKIYLQQTYLVLLCRYTMLNIDVLPVSWTFSRIGVKELLAGWLLFCPWWWWWWCCPNGSGPQSTNNVHLGLNVLLLVVVLTWTRGLISVSPPFPHSLFYSWLPRLIRGHQSLK